MRRTDTELLLPSAARLMQAQEAIDEAEADMAGAINAELYGGTPEARVQLLRESMGLAPSASGMSGLGRWLP